MMTRQDKRLRKEEPMQENRRIAVLIDADNVSPKYIRHILDEIAAHGTPTYKRIYGDWTKPQMTEWKKVLLEYSVTPIQQYSYTTGKNATDSCLIIDAMDILYSGNVEGFCIVSSDSDFTRLAARLRESGQYVLGMGEKKTPRPFVVACEKFKYLETLMGAPVEPVIQAAQDKAPAPQVTAKARAELIDAIRTIVTETSDEDGWAYLANVGTLLSRRQPDFDSRNYGFTKLTPLVQSLGAFEFESRDTGISNVKHNYIRNRE